MTDTQIFTIALATVPTMITVLVGILINNARLSDLRVLIESRMGDTNTRIGDMNSRIGDTNSRIAELRTHMDSRFNDVDRRFEEMKDMWRSELHRVEEVLDARLKHLEER